MTCDCRKPGPGMVRQAQQQFQIDLTRSFVVGDKASDLGLARSVGARGVLVRTGYGEVELTRMGGSAQAARVSTDLMEATSWILEQAAAPAGGA
jgi:histidinol phosphatase-like enzyme